ncbi:MAG: hypothetical protein K6A90_14200 [Lachnospiraceae bacterium]|nr:hypothetical protein [Lachnospiraceae bacterium]
MNIEFTIFPPKIECHIQSEFSSDIPYSEIELKFDSGADITCVPAALLGITKSKEEFCKWIQTHDNLEFDLNGKHKTRKPDK